MIPRLVVRPTMKAPHSLRGCSRIQGAGGRETGRGRIHRARSGLLRRPVRSRQGSAISHRPRSPGLPGLHRRRIGARAENWPRTGRRTRRHYRSRASLRAIAGDGRLRGTCPGKGAHARWATGRRLRAGEAGAVASRAGGAGIAPAGAEGADGKAPAIRRSRELDLHGTDTPPANHPEDCRANPALIVPDPTNRFRSMRGIPVPGDGDALLSGRRQACPPGRTHNVARRSCRGRLLFSRRAGIQREFPMKRGSRCGIQLVCTAGGRVRHR